MSNSLTLCESMDCIQFTRLLCPWDSPSKNTGVGCNAFLQRSFLTRGLNPSLLHCFQCRGSSVCLQCRTPGFHPWSGRSPGEGNGNPLQYSCLENPMDRGAWWATVHRVAKRRTRLNDFTSFLLHCRQILYCLSHLGSPSVIKKGT